MVLQSNVAVGLAVVAAVYASFYLYLQSCKRTVESEARSGCIPFHLPNFTITSLPNRLVLFLSSLRRFLIDRPNRGVSNAMKVQCELAKEGECDSPKIRTIYFIRHGQSIWNMTFDYRSNILLILWRVVRLIATELFFSPTNDTFLYDSPLSINGINQALEMSKKLCNPESANCEDIKLLTRHSDKRCALFTSNLRRAQSTIMLALHDRLSHTNDVVEVCNELEELVPHPDCVALSTTFQSSTIPLLEIMMVPDKAKSYSRFLRHYYGPGVSTRSAYERMIEFNNRIFNRKEENIIVCGHSSWIRNYLSIFLPKGSQDMEFCHKKIGNLDTLRVDVQCHEGRYYSVDPNSVKLVYKNTK
ncbi:hypothetical protein BaOVIS_024860 [Babesia ovis]|uniref:Phosphoglycerate mutase family protein n=1 Tax=Babesia ovis TaxID=5869 RepID=A0A9W5TE81_BABOV|nr:hypothetical protein BaOVIS_024860 [Babesia ovis]